MMPPVLESKSSRVDLSAFAQPKVGGKYSRLRRELSLVSRSGSERVCVVTVEETDNGPESESEVVAAHTSGGNGNLLFGIPTTISQAMEHDDSEYWKAAILDDINNHEEIFQVFGPPIPKQHGMKVTPTRFLFSQKLVSYWGSQRNF